MFNLFIIFLPMKLQRTKSGFTLIELLVVITIIGILATGAVSVYTSQIQKSRDSVRLTDVTAVRWWIEQYYQDNAQYPDSTNVPSVTATHAFSWVIVYTPKLPKDPKSGQARTWAAFDYIYTVWSDDNSVLGQDFEISTTFEQQWNITEKAQKDWWSDAQRYELWIDLTWNQTDVTNAVSANSLECVAAAWWAAVSCSDAWTRLVIKW